MSKLSLAALRFSRQRAAARDPHINSVQGSTHLAEIAGIVAAVTHDEKAIAAAWLRDCIEHRQVTWDELLALFGRDIANAVLSLTDTKQTGDRRTLHAESCLRLSSAPGWVQDVKCAELIAQLAHVTLHSAEQSSILIDEVRGILAAMKNADPSMYALALESVQQAVADVSTHVFFTAPDGTSHLYPLSVMNQADREDFRDAFLEAVSDKADGILCNEHPLDSPSWHGYKLGVLKGAKSPANQRDVQMA